MIDDVAGGLTLDMATFRIELESGTELAVRGVALREALNELSSCVITVLAARPAPDVADLLGKDVALHVERLAQARSFRGLIRYATRHELVEGVELRLHAVPAAWLLTRSIGSRIFQDKTVPEIVKEVVDGVIGSRQRSVELSLTRSYPQYEYVVQYQESCWSFIARLCEQEGILLYFEHAQEGQDHEVLVLADSSSNLPQVRSGPVPFWGDPGQAIDHEAVSSAVHHQEIGTTDAVVADFDWTNPSLTVRGEQTGRGDAPALELYDHTDAVQFYKYSGTQYDENTSRDQARLRIELLDLMRQRWEMTSTLVAMQPGYLFDLSGAPDGLDAKYLVVGLNATASATEGSTGHWANTLEVVPSSMPYRPRRVTRKPAVVGPETATVVGPGGEEIYTDRHGLVKVQMHWDRQGQRDEHSSCWLRVAQGWAGPGWGMFFLPRIGMEVIVSFVTGNPDRPFITGCLYNGKNTPPYTLPDHKTRSTLKTNSSIGGDGYNELRFEDKKGSEEVWIHAQKDFNEVVEHDHTTRVKHDQSNRVDHDQSESIGHDQTLHVEHDRQKSVDNDEETQIGRDRTESVARDETVSIGHNRTHKIANDDALTVDHARYVTVLQGQVEKIHNGHKNEITGDRITKVQTDDSLTVTGKYEVSAGAHWLGVCQPTRLYFDSKTLVGAASAQVKWSILGDSSLLELKAGGVAELKGLQSVKIATSGSSIEMTPDKITIQAPTVEIRGSVLVDIDGGLVQIKC